MRPQIKVKKRKRRHLRVRKKVIGTEERPRLTVRKSLSHIYAQLVVDPPIGPSHVLTGASSRSPDLKSSLVKAKGKVEKARLVGKLLAAKAKSKGLSKIVFDRSGYKYHGRIRALAEEARKDGLEF